MRLFELFLYHLSSTVELKAFHAGLLRRFSHVGTGWTKTDFASLHYDLLLHVTSDHVLEPIHTNQPTGKCVLFF